jgi:hypothetical protein
MCWRASAPPSSWHGHVLTGMAWLLLLHLHLMKAVRMHRSKPHAAGAPRPVTRRHAGISACLAERFRAFIPPSGPESGGR